MNKVRLKPIWGRREPIERKDMNWSQAKWNFPKLKPMGDRDRDGVKNQFDCRPLNRKRQDEEEYKDDSLPSDSEWKREMVKNFKTVGDLKNFVEGKVRKGDKDD